MYQAWPWGGTAVTTASSDSAYLQTSAAQVATAQWPAGYNQYAITPELQQQWAAAWASQAQYYGSTVAVAQAVPTTAAYGAAWPEGYQAAANVAAFGVGTGTDKQSSATEKKSTEKTKPDVPAEELVPKDSAELEKLNQLKAQAEQWKSLRQPATAAWPYSAADATSTNSTTTSSVNWAQAYGQQVLSKGQEAAAAAAQNSILSANVQKIAAGDAKEEEEFERQFNEWEKQFEAWKQQNINHPDKEAFARYEKQWQEWRSQLLQKKEQMQKTKAERMPNKAEQDPSAAGTNAEKAYYQNSPYIYMQPYGAYPSTGGMTMMSPMMPHQFQYPESASEMSGFPDPDDPKKPLLPLPGMDPSMKPDSKTLKKLTASQMRQIQIRQDPMRLDPMHQSQMRQNAMRQNQMRHDPMGQSQMPIEDAMYPDFDGNENPDMFMPGMEGELESDWQFTRGRGRGSTRSRGRGGRRGRGRGRWITSPEADIENSMMDGRSQVPGFPQGGVLEELDDRLPFEKFPPDAFPEDFMPEEGDCFPGNRPPLRDEFQGGPPPFPDEFNEGFPEPPFDERFMHESKGFPLRDGERFMRGSEFEDFPPMHDDGFGLGPPFPEDFPPERLPYDEGCMLPGRGRFPGPPGMRNRDFPPPEEFDDRFAAGPPGRMRRGVPRRSGGQFRPREFPPEDEFRFGYPLERMPPGKGMLPPFDDPGFGPPRPGPGFPEDPYFDDGPPIQFETIDYTHRPAASVLGKDFQENYEYESQFDNDVMNYRDNFSSDCNLSSKNPPIIFSQVNVEAFDYDHGLKPMTTSTTKGKKKSEDDQAASAKVYDYAHRREKSPVHPDKNYNRELSNKEEPFLNRNRDAPFRNEPWDDHFRDSPRGAPFRDGPREPFRDGMREPPYRDGMREPPYRDGMREPPYRDGPREPLLRDGPREPLLRDGPREPLLRDGLRDPPFRDHPREPPFRDGPMDMPFREGPEQEAYRERERERNRERDRNRDMDKDHDRDREGKENRNKDNERDNKRDREWERDRKDKDDGDREKRFKWEKADVDKHSLREKSDDFQSKRQNGERNNSSDYKKQSEAFKNESSNETSLIKDLLFPPGRLSRPKQLVIILRGLPGSGKTYVAKLIKDKEIENGGSAPRILSLDDYFMQEAETTEVDPDTGKRIKKKEFQFEYESEMEEAYRASLFKSFKKTIDDRFFPFIIVDAVHEKSKHYDQYWSYAKQRGFQVYIAEMDCVDPVICHKRNVHKRTLEDITKILKNWDKKPRHFLSLDVRSLLQDVAITEVEMEVESTTEKKPEVDDKALQEDDIDEENAFMQSHVPSRWEKLEATEEKLDQLDGLRVTKKKHSSMEDYLQLPDDYEERKCEPGKKRVRWADLEERKEQDRLRAIGFVVGQTDWSKLTDPTHADRALTKTKYF